MIRDLTPPEHEHSEAVIQAAQWHDDQNPPPQPIIPVLRERFGLSAKEACEAAALSHRYKIQRGAFA